MKYVYLFVGSFIIALVIAFFTKIKGAKRTSMAVSKKPEPVTRVKEVVPNEALQIFLATYLDYTSELLYDFLENYSQVISLKRDNRQLSVAVLEKMKHDNLLDLIALRPVLQIVILDFQSPNKMVVEVHYEKAIHEMNVTVLPNAIFVDNYTIKVK